MPVEIVQDGKAVDLSTVDVNEILSLLPADQVAAAILKTLTPDKLPEELVGQHPMVKNARSESAERRQKIAALTAQLAQATQEPADPKQPATPTADPAKQPEATPLSAEQMYAEMRRRMAEESQANTKRTADVKAIMKSEGLNPDDADLFSIVSDGISDMDAIRQKSKALALKGMKFTPTPSGGAGDPNADGDLISRVTSRIMRPPNRTAEKPLPK